MDNKYDNYTFLTQAPIDKVILRMSLPTIVTMLVTSVYNMADTFFVGRLNTQSTAAVGVVFSMMFFIQALGFFFGNGSGNYISRELGAKRHKNACKMASNGFFYSFFFGIFMLILGEIFLDPLCLLLGSTPTILPYTKKFLEVILIGAPFMTSSLTLNNQMRFQGNATYAMYGMVTGAILNCFLDPIFIFVFNLGVMGAAISTVIGQIVSFFILLRMTYHRENIGIYWKNFTPTWQAAKEIFYGGSPSLSRQGLACLSTVALNYTAGFYGDAAIAAMSIVNRISMLVMAAVIGLGQGFQPFCGFCYGARLYTRLKKGYWFTVKVGTSFLVIVAVVGFAFSDNIILLFRNDLDVIKIGTVALRWQLITYPLNAIVLCSNMMTQTCRKTLRANILAAARQGLFFIPLILSLPHFWGLLGIEMCQSWSDMLSFILMVPIMTYTFREFSREEIVYKAKTGVRIDK